MLAKNGNASDYFFNHKKNKYSLGNKKQNIEEDLKNLVGKSLDNKNIKNMLFRYILKDWLFINKLSSFLKEIEFNKQEFPTGIAISEIKYNHLRT